MKAVTGYEDGAHNGRGESMTRATALPVEERILQLLQYLGIEQAHFAGLLAGFLSCDYSGEE